MPESSLQTVAGLESLWVEADGLRLHALVAATGDDGDCAPVVLVHGLGVSGRYMIPTALRLAGGTEVFVPDLPGFGLSDKPPRVLSITELADSLDRWMEAAGIGRAALVGHSLGCQVVAEFALRRPEKIERVVLASPTSEPRARTVVRQLWRFLLDIPREPFSLVPLVSRDYLTAGLMRCVRTFRLSLQDHIEEKLPSMGMPTLVVRGARDPVVPQHWAEEVTQRLPRGELKVIEGAAHAVNFSEPSEFARAIGEFLRRG